MPEETDGEPLLQILQACPFLYKKWIILETFIVQNPMRKKSMKDFKQVRNLSLGKFHPCL